MTAVVPILAALIAGDGGFPAGPEAVPAAPLAGAPEAAAIEAAIDRGVRFLIARQNPDGSWGSARRTKDLNIYASVPGSHLAFRAATSALCLAALIEIDPPGEDARRAIARGEEWLLGNLPDVRRATEDTLYNVWAHAYGIEACVKVLRRHGAQDPAGRRAREVVLDGIDRLRRYENVNGGWCYYDFDIGAQRPADSTISFVSATVLVALRAAEDAGIEPPAPMVERAVASIRRQMKPDFSYLYGEYLKWRPQRAINRPGGSLGRSQACNLALRMWGGRDVTDEVLRIWLRKLADRNLWLDIGRKRPIPHESWFQVAGYFFYYGHYYGARCLELLPPGERGPFRERIAGIIIERQEKDGSWLDYPFYDYGHSYGTGFALMTLVRCRGESTVDSRQSTARTTDERKRTE